jgi:hypothetical protein
MTCDPRVKGFIYNSLRQEKTGDLLEVNKPGGGTSYETLDVAFQ